ncbi:DUF5701 family protein [Puerhibacterium puerhi]|uniref:DUF5701 family protein n=1 Tax=Puerhibacterium puerhi TaxID=2692623 RepID=UPI00135C3732|nr:DUF5701 family protein [Puerhibacterium puerhi]
MSDAAGAAQPAAPPALPPLHEQAERLVALGALADGGVTPAALRDAADRLAATAPPGALLVLAPAAAPPSRLAPLLRLPAPGRQGGERAGFVVTDMTDVDAFAPVVELPDALVYAVVAPDRGDDLRGWSPAEAAAELAARGRTPLTLAEGIHWALQAPSVLDKNVCYMTIGSRLRRPDGRYDARTPALWISGGTGRDGRERRGAPKVGWCWWNNRHTWLGFGSTTRRVAP